VLFARRMGMKKNRARDVRRPLREREETPRGGARRRQRTPPPASDVSQLPREEMTPRVRSAVMQLMDELDRLKDELVAANERVTELEDMADEDPLVPVLNRRGFTRELERTLAYVRRYGTQVSLVYLDLDEFKAVNDRHGHAAGDAVLQHFAQLLMANVRRSDLVGRLGGDEFAIVLHHADAEAAACKAAQLAERLAREPAMHEGREIRLGMTAGVAELCGEDTVESVLERADRAMYENKTRRRAQAQETDCADETATPQAMMSGRS
jgi:diguanylate cyclase (GGDEF)-like protein